MTPVIITAEILGAGLAVAGLGVVASAKEWVHIAVAVTVKPIPASKRQPRNPVQVVNVLPGTVEQPAEVPVITSAGRKTG